MENLCNSLGQLVSNKRSRKSIGEKAREYVSKNHTLEGAAKAYYDFICEVHKKRGDKSVLEELADIGISMDKPYAFGDFTRAMEELGIEWKTIVSHTEKTRR